MSGDPKPPEKTKDKTLQQSTRALALLGLLLGSGIGAVIADFPQLAASSQPRAILYGPLLCLYLIGLAWAMRMTWSARAKEAMNERRAGMLEPVPRVVMVPPVIMTLSLLTLFVLLMNDLGGSAVVGVAFSFLAGYAILHPVLRSPRNRVFGPVQYPTQQDGSNTSQDALWSRILEQLRSREREFDRIGKLRRARARWGSLLFVGLVFLLGIAIQVVSLFGTKMGLMVDFDRVVAGSLLLVSFSALPFWLLVKTSRGAQRTLKAARELTQIYELGVLKWSSLDGSCSSPERNQACAWVVEEMNRVLVRESVEWAKDEEVSYEGMHSRLKTIDRR